MQVDSSSTNAEEWRIRPAEPRDTTAITHLSEQLGYPMKSSDVEHQLALLHSLDHHAVLVAESNQGQVLGWVHIFERPLLIQEAGAELGGLVVEKSVRELGVGRAVARGEKNRRAAGGAAVECRHLHGERKGTQRGSCAGCGHHDRRASCRSGRRLCRGGWNCRAHCADQDAGHDADCGQQGAGRAPDDGPAGARRNARRPWCHAAPHALTG